MKTSNLATLGSETRFVLIGFCYPSRMATAVPLAASAASP